MGNSDPGGRSPIRWVLTAAPVLALAAFICIAWYLLFLRPEVPYNFTDLDYYRAALQTVVAQQPLLTTLPYPPVAVLAIAGLGGLPVLLGNQLWTAGTLILALVLVAVLTQRSFEARGEDHPKPRDFLPSVSIGAILLLTSSPMVSQVVNGQLSLLIITLSFLDLARVLPRRAQGILIGIAAAIKLTPLIFIPYFLVTGQRRQAAVATASFGVVTALGFLIFPSDSFAFWTHVGRSQFGEPGRIDNLSINAAIVRWIPAAAGQPMVWIGLGLIVAVFALLRARSHFRAGEVMEAALIVGAASVVIAPISWPHYHVWVMLVALWLVSFPQRRHQLIAAGTATVYSLPFPLLLTDAANAGNPIAMAAFDLKVLIPVLIGLFGLPFRASTKQVASGSVVQAETVPTAA